MDEATLTHEPLDRQADSGARFVTGSVSFVGTATTLIRYGGFTILTDPNFLHRGEHVHLGYGVTSTRLTDPALQLDELPRLDLVTLSHLHEDHFDRVVQRRLNHRLPIVTTPSAATALHHMGFTTPYGLKTWQTLLARKDNSLLRLTSLPARHGPGLVARLLPEVMGTMLEFQPAPNKTALRLYISGDTLLFEGLQAIPQHFPSIDLALLHLGGTRIFGVLVTMDAAMGVEVLRIIAPQQAIPIHNDDYTVFKSPLDHFARAVREAGLEDNVTYLRRGETYTFEVPEGRWR